MMNGVVSIDLTRYELELCVAHSTNIVQYYARGNQGVYNHNQFASNMIGVKGEYGTTKWMNTFLDDMHVKKHFKTFPSDPTKKGDISFGTCVIEVKSLRQDLWPRLGRMVPPAQLARYISNGAIIIWVVSTSNVDDPTVSLMGWNYALDVQTHGVFIKTICDNIWLRDADHMRDMSNLHDIFADIQLELDMNSIFDNHERVAHMQLDGVIGGENARDLDQFFTKPELAIECVEFLKTTLKCSISEFDLVLEPSCGDYAFVNALRASVDVLKLKFFDIDAIDKVHRANFLTDAVVPREYSGLCLTIGNPPFGKSASTAVAFFNRAAEFSACIAFIVPRTFSKDSIHRRLNHLFFLVFEHVLEKDSFLFQNKSYSVPCVFQVWVHAKYATRLIIDELRGDICDESIREPPVKLTKTPEFTFVKRPNDPDIAIRRVGVHAGRIFEGDISQHSEQSHFFIQINDKRRKTEVIDKLKSLELEKTESKFQTAGNPSISKAELCKLFMNKE